RQIIETMRTTKDPQCYFPLLDATLKAMDDVSTAAKASAPAPAAAIVYANPSYQWSVSYPADWKLDSADPRRVGIFSPTDFANCGFHVDATRLKLELKTADEFADSVERYDEEEHLTTGHSAKQRISLPNEVTGFDVVREIRGGGKSRRIYMLRDGVR